MSNPKIDLVFKALANAPKNIDCTNHDVICAAGILVVTTAGELCRSGPRGRRVLHGVAGLPRSGIQSPVNATVTAADA
jgi:hypothetical protein